MAGSVSIRVQAGGQDVGSVPEGTTVTITARCAWEFQDHPRRLIIDYTEPNGTKHMGAWIKELYDTGGGWNEDNPAGSDTLTGQMSLSYIGPYVFESRFQYYADGDRVNLIQFGPAAWALDVYAVPAYDLHISASGHGTTDPPPGYYSYNDGTTVNVRAIPESGGAYVFQYWDLDGVSYTVNPIPVLIDRKRELTAYFTGSVVGEWNVQGYVSNVDGGDVPSTTRVRASPGGATAAPDYMGFWQMTLNPGVYDFTCTEPGYVTQRRQFNIYPDTLNLVNFDMYRPDYSWPFGQIAGYVKTQDGHAISGATVSIPGYGELTDYMGWFGSSLVKVPVGTYALQASHPNFEPASISVTVTSGYITKVNVVLGPKALKYTLTIATSTYGSTDPVAGSYQYPKGTAVSVKATPYVGYMFDHWLLDGTSYAINPLPVTMNEDLILSPFFVPEEVITTGSASGYVKTPDGAPLAGATVKTNGASITTDGSGYYSVILEAGTYTLTASMSGYGKDPSLPNSASVTVIAGSRVDVADLFLKLVGVTPPPKKKLGLMAFLLFMASVIGVTGYGATRKESK